MNRLCFLLFLTLTCHAEWTPDQKQWALGTSGILTKMANSRLDILFGTEQNAGNQIGRAHV